MKLFSGVENGGGMPSIFSIRRTRKQIKIAFYSSLSYWAVWAAPIIRKPIVENTEKNPNLL